MWSQICIAFQSQAWASAELSSSAKTDKWKRYYVRQVTIKADTGHRLPTVYLHSHELDISLNSLEPATKLGLIISCTRQVLEIFGTYAAYSSMFEDVRVLLTRSETLKREWFQYTTTALALDALGCEGRISLAFKKQPAMIATRNLQNNIDDNYPPSRVRLRS